MQTQRQRDDKTVAIATGLGLFMLTVAVGSALLWTADLLFDWRSQVTNVLFKTLVSSAVVAAVVYLFRIGRR
ncbi:MAG TPA: hypothetical protein VFJ19_19820 [Nocardioidaceae bacterium]|nr:hypothetical protein [Nocardioidaceae bacterium]